jgi:gliding motility-associated-like protein
MILRYLLILLLFSCCLTAYGQQDMDLHLNATFLPGKNILKVKRDFNDPYLWVLAQGNQVYRINSITKAVDDYTSQFSVFSGQQFIDIAGVNQNLVYIACNASIIVELKNGNIKTIGAPEGILGVVNSIGVDYTSNYVPDNTNGMGGRYAAKNLIIGTNSGMCHYDYENSIMLPKPSHVEARVFEATYRSEMFSDLEYGHYNDVVQQYPVIELTTVTTFGGYLWYGNYGGFGDIINTAYYTDGALRDDPLSYLNTFRMNQLWGTDNGLFVNERGYSYAYMWGSKQFLNNIPVTKITSIYGLKAYGESIAKENILAGTKQGLYFSTSGYGLSGAIIKPDYNFFHYDELGNVAINDICVNATSYTKPICEDGIWIAAANGLYLLKPDYAPYINPVKKLSAIQFESKSFDISEIQVCGNVAAKAFVQSNFYNGNTIQWYKDGVELSNESNTTLNITQAGDYNAILYDPCTAIHFETNHLKATIISGPVFTFNYPDNLKYCAGSTAVLQTENNANYQYRWYKDGILNGNTTSTLNITQAGKYKLEVSACSGSWVPGKEVQVDFINVPPPIITADKTAYCAGSAAVLTATVPIDATGIINWAPYQFRWYINSIPINSNTSAVFNASLPGKYRVEVNTCSGAWVISAEFQLNFITLTVPAITTNKAAYCMGDIAALSTSFINDGSYTINWLRNGTVIPAAKNLSNFNTNVAGNYTVSVSSNLTTCSQSSVAYTLSFDAPPSISLERIVNTTLCDGQTVDLKASYSGGTVKWSTGETTSQIAVKQSGTYTATVKTTAGCEVAQNIDVQFSPNPTLHIPDATLCQFTNDQLTLTAPSGFMKYEWNGQAGGQTYIVSTLGSINLTVTDQNGCKASQTINITSHCKDIHIPNTFTPNGDGINDKWMIAGLEGDLTVNVKVYTRTGELVFQSQGYATPWEGTYQGKKLPAAVYYYVINAKGSNQVLSGPITIIY